MNTYHCVHTAYVLQTLKVYGFVHDGGGGGGGWGRAGGGISVLLACACM